MRLLLFISFYLQDLLFDKKIFILLRRVFEDLIVDKGEADNVMDVFFEKGWQTRY